MAAINSSALNSLKIFLAMGHLRFVDDSTALMLVVDLLDRKGIADNVLGQSLPPVAIIAAQLLTFMGTDA